MASPATGNPPSKSNADKTEKSKRVIDEIKYILNEGDLPNDEVYDDIIQKKRRELDQKFMEVEIKDKIEQGLNRRLTENVDQMIDNRRS